MIFIGLFVVFLSVFQYTGDVVGLLGGLFCGFVMGMLLLSSNIRKKNDKFLWEGSGAILVVLLTIITFSLVRGANVPEGLANACTFYDDYHVEDYDCTCGF